jgi:ribosomal protein S18 acetylase RimI-like enzyme
MEGAKFMDIRPATPKDAEWLDDVIRREFPYTDFCPEQIISRINDRRFLVLVAWQKNIPSGFAELELFPEKEEARLNALYVEDSMRLQRFGTKLVERCLHEVRHMHFHRVFLLVKKDNDSAKRLYERLEFKFEGMHTKELDGSKVEVWSIQLSKVGK